MLSTTINQFTHSFVRPEYAKRHDKVIFQHDNARPNVAESIKETLDELRLYVLPHLPYSPEIAPSDYHLFRSIQHSLIEQNLNCLEDVKEWLDDWIAEKPEKFFYNGIHMLPKR